jgi:hypothetical protein
VNLFHEVDDFLTEEELGIVDNNIMSKDFPWYYHQDSTSTLFPFFSHVIYARNTARDDDDYKVLSNSPMSHFMGPIVNRYCKKYLNKPVEKIYRSCLNLSFGWNVPYTHMEPHVDHKFEHHNLLIYLNTVNQGGETIIFDKYYFEGMDTCFTINEYDKVESVASISAQRGKAVCFDGKLFHSINNFPTNDKRVVLVTTFK